MDKENVAYISLNIFRLKQKGNSETCYMGE
jgi:hypothetical protein